MSTSVHGQELLTEARFRLAQEEPISATVPRTEVRTFLRRISDQRRVAILLDGRIDPNQKRDIRWVELSLFEALYMFAGELDASLSVVADTFVIGPDESLRELRTLAQLRLDELSQMPDLDPGHYSRLRRRSHFCWQDLDRPRDLLESLERRYELRIENPELIPHDLWGGGEIAHANAPELLTIILMQFDLSFVWGPQATSIRLVSFPDSAAVERSHLPRRLRTEQALPLITAELPHLSPRTEGPRIVVSARVEEHERIEELLGLRVPREVRIVPAVPLSRRVFRLTVVDQSVGAVLQELAAQGVPIVLDAEQLTRDGADLSVKVSLQLEQARIGELMSRLCEPAGLTYEIHEERIYLRVP